MLKACHYCGRIHAKDYDCGKRPKRWKKGGREDAFRSTAAWQRKRNEIRDRDNQVCQCCIRQGRLTIDNLSVHHIVPLAVDWERRLDNDNLITLCAECHERAEDEGIPRGYLLQIAAEKESPLGCRGKQIGSPTPTPYL